MMLRKPSLRWVSALALAAGPFAFLHAADQAGAEKTKIPVKVAVVDAVQWNHEPVGNIEVSYADGTIMAMAVYGMEINDVAALSPRQREEFLNADGRNRSGGIRAGGTQAQSIRSSARVQRKNRKLTEMEMTCLTACRRRECALVQIETDSLVDWTAVTMRQGDAA